MINKLLTVGLSKPWNNPTIKRRDVMSGSYRVGLILIHKKFSRKVMITGVDEDTKMVFINDKWVSFKFVKENYLCYLRDEEPFDELLCVQ